MFHRLHKAVLGFLCLSFSLHPLLRCFAAQGPNVDWGTYLGDKASSHYSKLVQIDSRNVKHLRVAWTYHSGDARDGGRSQIQCNPLIIDGVLFGTSPGLKLFALEASSGKELWKFDPFAIPGMGNTIGVNRGVTFWSDRAESRIFFAASHYLFAVDARSGRLVKEFGDNGRIDLRENLGRDTSSDFILANTPGIIFKDRLIIGTRVNEGPGPAAPGHIRAYNVRSGKLEWIFHTIPHPGESGHETWPPDAWKTAGGANCWAGMALDERRGIVYVPTGSAAFDFWGGDRLGANLYANCLIALDATTGRRVWHYQLFHHDLWDRDLPAPPNLLTVRQNGRSIDAVAQVTKSGFIFLFDRVSGKPLFPIEERPVPPSDLQGESAWPTQPFPLTPPPFARQQFTSSLISEVTPNAKSGLLEKLQSVRPHYPFVPPSKEGTIIFPGFDGGAEWGGAAVDQKTSIVYVNANEMPWILKMVETRKEMDTLGSSGEQIFRQICAVCHGLNKQGDPARAFPSLVGVEKRLKRSGILALLQTGRGVMPSVAFLTTAQREAVTSYVLGEQAESANAQRDLEMANMTKSPYTHTGYNRFLDKEGYPAIKPPWGTLNAVNLRTGKIEWTKPLGELPELTARGIPPTGTENYGGPIVTAGGVVFIAASKDEYFRAYDSKTGEILWKAKLPAAGYATPSTYSVGGKQFVVIACGGGKCGTPSGDAYVAFSLP